MVVGCRVRRTAGRREMEGRGAGYAGPVQGTSCAGTGHGDGWRGCRVRAAGVGYVFRVQRVRWHVGHARRGVGYAPGSLFGGRGRAGCRVRMLGAGYAARCRSRALGRAEEGVQGTRTPV